MSDNVKWLFIIIGLTAMILIIRFVVTAVINKGADAVRNAVVNKKNQQAPNEPTSLADKYRK